MVQEKYKLVKLRNGTVNLMEGRTVVENYEDQEEADKALVDSQTAELLNERVDNFITKLRMEVEIEFGKKYSTEEMTILLKSMI